MSTCERIWACENSCGRNLRFFCGSKTETEICRYPFCAIKELLQKNPENLLSADTHCFLYILLQIWGSKLLEHLGLRFNRGTSFWLKVSGLHLMWDENTSGSTDGETERPWVNERIFQSSMSCLATPPSSFVCFYPRLVPFPQKSTATVARVPKESPSFWKLPSCSASLLSVSYGLSVSVFSSAASLKCLQMTQLWNSTIIMPPVV